MIQGPYAAFILGAYAAAAAIVGGLIVWIVLDGYHLSRALRKMELQGVMRRSERDKEANL